MTTPAPRSTPASPAHLGRPAPVIATGHSPHARLRPVGIGDVRFADRFWQPRRERLRAVTLGSQFDQLEHTGRLDNFLRAAGRFDGPFQGRYFNDSDVYKWVEAACWTLAGAGVDDPALRRLVDETVATIAAAQGDDGYLNTFFTFEREGERWSNLKDHHELYCAGHLFQAAVAHHRATGETTLLGVATRFAALIESVFGPGGRPGTCGHPEIEMGLVELGRETGEPRWVALAGHLLDMRGREPTALTPGYGLDSAPPDYFQDHAPVREQRAVTGHAVRALYLYAGMTDCHLETGDLGLGAAALALWDEFQARQAYVTGGAGAHHRLESFGDPYELPNGRAYAETCAAIAHVMWAWRLLTLTGEARFAGAMETALHNGVLSGLSLDGECYFYVNPLADEGQHRRQPWFGTACCPPNIARLVASLPGYAASVSPEGLWLHLYVAGTIGATLPGGDPFTLHLDTDYPFDGVVAVTVLHPPRPETTLALRIPAWAGGATVTVNGEPVAGPARPESYVAIRRTWRAGDEVRLDLPMAVRPVTAHPRVEADRGRLALLRGPLVYCLEGCDHPGIDIRDVRVAAGDPWVPDSRPDLLGGVTTLRGRGTHVPAAGEPLYRPGGTPSSAGTPVELTAIPYALWANREAGPMRVWLPAGDG